MEHRVGYGYDGEGVYGWTCECGAAGSDFKTADDAAMAASEHEAETEPLVEAMV